MTQILSSLRPFAQRALCLLPMLAMVASPSLPVAAVTSVAPAQKADRKLPEILAQMSTGSDQELMLAGMDARSRNARIAMASGTSQMLPSYAPIAAGSAHYPMALKCLTQAVYYEAANETAKGKRAVAQVVLNRMRHPAYPNSVCGVVYQGVNAPVCQFSFTCDGALLRKPLERQWQESRAVAKAALSGEQLADVGTATHYHADYVLPKWAYTLGKTQVIGTHIFYRFPGRAGNATAFRARWSGAEYIPALNWARLANAARIDHLGEAEEIEKQWVPGLTVVPDQKDRHAKNDVGGRLDTTKQWRLTIPDPVAGDSSYKATIAGQGDAKDDQGTITLSQTAQEAEQ